jgi:hypothetical protein
VAIVRYNRRYRSDFYCDSGKKHHQQKERQAFLLLRMLLRLLLNERNVPFSKG